jgi:hypothetical protein
MRCGAMITWKMLHFLYALFNAGTYATRGKMGILKIETRINVNKNANVKKEPEFRKIVIVRRGR